MSLITDAFQDLLSKALKDRSGYWVSGRNPVVTAVDQGVLLFTEGNTSLIPRNWGVGIFTTFSLPGGEEHGPRMHPLTSS